MGAKVVPVGITLGSPRFKLVYRHELVYVRELAPKREIFGLNDRAEFEPAYIRLVLEPLGVDWIRERLATISAEDGGRPRAFVFRRHLAAWRVVSPPGIRRLVEQAR